VWHWPQPVWTFVIVTGLVAGCAALAVAPSRAAERTGRSSPQLASARRASDRAVDRVGHAFIRHGKDLLELADSSTSLRWKAEPVAWAQRGAPAASRVARRRPAEPARLEVDPFEKPIPIQRVARHTATVGESRVRQQWAHRRPARRSTDPDVRTVQLESSLGPPDARNIDDATPPDGTAAARAPESGHEQPTPFDQLAPGEANVLRPPAPLDDADVLKAESRVSKREECHVALEKLRSNHIHDIGLDIGVPGHPGDDFPVECALNEGPANPRSWPETTYTWKASAVCHKPLYFQELALERYGHSLGPFLQPIYSGAHFFATLPILPYEMGLRPPKECVYTLGHYRPGSCAPYLIDPIPLSVRAGLLEAGAAVGVSAIVP